METTEEYNLEGLPDEILYNIGEYLDYPSLSGVGRTSTTGRRITSDILEKEAKKDIESFYTEDFHNELWQNPFTKNTVLLEGIYRRQTSHHPINTIETVYFHIPESILPIPTFGSEKQDIRLEYTFGRVS